MQHKMNSQRFRLAMVLGSNREDTTGSQRFRLVMVLLNPHYHYSKMNSQRSRLVIVLRYRRAGAGATPLFG